MGLVLDSSIIIGAERQGETVFEMVKRIASVTGDQRAVLTSVGLTELVHGIYRAQDPQIRSRREKFISDL
jgi:hypothetical protein